MRRKIILLGGKGFIGSELTKFFSSKEYFYAYDLYSLSKIDFDLTDTRSVSRISKFLDKDSILIVTSGIKRQLGDDIVCFGFNILIAENLVRIIKLSPPRTLVFLSSAAVYGESGRREAITEATYINPSSYYGIAKYSSERLLERACLDSGVSSYFFLRIPLVYGLGDKSAGYGPVRMLQQAKKAAAIEIWGDGEELREFIYIEDISKLISNLLEIEYKGALNLVSGTSYSFKQIAELLIKHCGPCHLRHARRTSDSYDIVFKNDLLIKLLNQEFRFTSLEAGILKMLGKMGG